MWDATPLLKLYARWRLSRLKRLTPVETQTACLLSLLNTAKDTVFGREHGFAEIRSVEEYQYRVSLRFYEDFWTEYWQKDFPLLKNNCWPGTIPYFPVTSGTSSGTTKYIPCTRAMLDANARAGLDLLCFHIHNKPDSKIFAGKSFVMGGSTDLVEERPGIFSGDLSGITTRTLPWWVRSRYFPRDDIALLKDWEKKVELIIDRILEQDIRSISGVPSWLLIFFDRLFDRYPEHSTLHELFPNLELIVHGGVNFAPYENQFKSMLGDSSAEFREVYPASEGFIGVADRGYGDGLRLILDNQIFYEFVPLEELESKTPTRHWIQTVEPDINYAVVLTNCSGMWSYVLGDTVRFVDCDVPRVLITGRTSYMLSAFGEHLIDEEIEDAVSSAAAAQHVHVTDYSVGAIFPEETGDLGGHLFYIECSTEKELSLIDRDLFISMLDARLCERNEDYEAHRAGGFGMRAPEVRLVNPGMFTQWMKRRGKLGGQHKVPRIITSDDLFQDLRQFMDSTTR